MAIKQKISKESEKRFWAKVNKTNKCWVWTAAVHEFGYGVFGVGKKTDKAHRISWILAKGPIPHGLCVLHKCDNPPCVNPDHLFLGTNKENHDDMVSKGRHSNPPPMGGWNKKTFPRKHMGKLGKMPDTKLGDIVGLNKHVIQRVRNSLGIPAFPCPTRFKKGDPHPRWHRDERRLIVRRTD